MQFGTLKTLHWIHPVRRSRNSVQSVTITVPMTHYATSLHCPKFKFHKLLHPGGMPRAQLETMKRKIKLMLLGHPLYRVTSPSRDPSLSSMACPCTV